MVKIINMLGDNVTSLTLIKDLKSHNHIGKLFSVDQGALSEFDPPIL